MGSIFATIPGNSIRGFLGKEQDVPFYLQFVPGYVIEVVHSKESLRYGGENTINSIIAIPHISDKLYKRRGSAGEEYRYFPLFRTVTDIPSKGDPVLLCSIGNIKYYLGPISTNTNEVTWNKDNLYTPEQLIGKDVGDISPRGSDGTSPNFNKNFLYKRLIKVRNIGLDFGTAVRETTGDTIFEGRHGNSIRIGSRSNNPYVFISNKRDINNDVESISDGSLISITSNGSLRQHFGGYDDIVQNVFVPGFQLASDAVPENKRLMSNLISSINQLDDIDPILYGYGSKDTGEIDENGEPIFEGIKANQILFSSDRITLNSKLDDIYLSSNKDIHIGSGRNLAISTNEDLIIESRNIYLGNPSPNQSPRDSDKAMEKMVLGNKLLDVLQDTLTALKNASALVQGVPVPLTDGTPAPESFALKIEPIEQKLEQILSQYHYIEPNGDKQ